MKRTISILGSGTFGLALARVLCNGGNTVTVWSPHPEKITRLRAERVCEKLNGMVIPEKILLTDDLSQACREKNVILFAVASPYVRETAAKAAPFVRDGQIIADVAKGIEASTHLSLSEVILEEMKKTGRHDHVRVVALSGPTHAEEIALDHPTTIVSACEDEEAAVYIQNIFDGTCIRAYTNRDIRGVELSGAMKNIVALAAGISDGLGFGDNSKAALITRGMTEIARLGKAMNCREETFYGLAGIGDLIVTATSRHSRNHRAGELIGQGMSPEDAVREVGMVVEGINALPAAMELSEKYRVELPISEMADTVIRGGISPKDAVTALMSREHKPERTQK